MIALFADLGHAPSKTSWVKQSNTGLRVGVGRPVKPADQLVKPAYQAGEFGNVDCSWEENMFISYKQRWCFAVMTLFVLPTGCGPLGNPPPGDGGGSTLAVFNDPDSEFSTSDVHDVENQIVRFDTQAKTIIWALDGRAFQPNVWEVNGNFLIDGNPFQVRFGNVDGERRAYFTETGPATICDIEVPGDTLLIFPTDTPVPQ